MIRVTKIDSTLILIASIKRCFGTDLKVKYRKITSKNENRFNWPPFKMAKNNSSFNSFPKCYIFRLSFLSLFIHLKWHTATSIWANLCKSLSPLLTRKLIWFVDSTKYSSYGWNILLKNTWIKKKVLLITLHHYKKHFVSEWNQISTSPQYGLKVI